MSYYRFLIRDNVAQADELGGMPLRDDMDAREFGTNIVRDLIRDTPSEHAGCTLEIVEGERAVAAIPFKSDAVRD
jgi:hypothetical protein